MVEEDGKYVSDDESRLKESGKKDGIKIGKCGMTYSFNMEKLTS